MQNYECFEWIRASLSARRAWIEMTSELHPLIASVTSLSARRAWIEIAQSERISGRALVALRKESVDRNFLELSSWGGWGGSLSARRAWIEIPAGCWRDARRALSLSARRAWIEMSIEEVSKYVVKDVALRKESVDRNKREAKANEDRYKSLSARRAWIEMGNSHTQADPVKSSLSARRAWIEIAQSGRISGRALVALRKESVDRNGHYCNDRSDFCVALRKESVDRNSCFSSY